MDVQILKNRLGSTIGKIKLASGIYYIYDRRGLNLGKYDPKTNVTKDRLGRTVGKGNLLTMLLNGD